MQYDKIHNTQSHLIPLILYKQIKSKRKIQVPEQARTKK